MLLSSCVRGLRQLTRTTPTPVSSMTIRSNRRFCSSNGKDETNNDKKDSRQSGPTVKRPAKRPKRVGDDYVELKVDWNQSVHLIFHKGDGSSYKQKAYINERIIDVVDRVDKARLIFHKFGICGGRLACGTCLVELEEEDFNKLLPAGDQELRRLDRYIEKITKIRGYPVEFGRLGCCVHVTKEMDGMKMYLQSEPDVSKKPEKKSANENDDDFDDGL